MRRQPSGNDGCADVVSLNTFSGTSRWTGPVRPANMCDHACRIMSGSMSGRVAWKLRFTYGRIAVTKSAWWCWPSSWNGPRLYCWVGMLPVIANTADESLNALAIATWMLTEPGPTDVNVASMVRSGFEELTDFVAGRSNPCEVPL